ncbi:MAG: hypothetical protein O3A46_11555 [Candidatus Poribacteria bacterium]|nr:hypothetical protein [Candidatus Poribacteria bacterium]
MKRTFAITGIFCMATLVASAQIANPADKRSNESSEEMTQESPQHKLRSWELPAVVVAGERSELREEDRIGTYEQPRWSASRRFGRTRVYVRPEGQFEFEYWFIPS